MTTVVGISLTLHARRAIRVHRVPMPYASREEIGTEDGSAIELRRLPGSGSGVPVLLVHGLGANHRNIDFLPDNSLARFLADAGRDVWLLTLRSGRRRRTWADSRKVSFEAMAQFDLPQAVAAVRRRTGAPQVDYIGFSMGGMLLYASLGRYLSEHQLRRAVLIGSPGLLRSPWFPSLFQFLWVPWLPPLYFDVGSTLAAFAVDYLHTPLHRLVYNPANVARGVASTAMVDVLVDIPGSLSMDFARWLTGDGLIRLSNGESVLDRLRTVDVPAQFFAGAGDQLASPDGVRAAYEAWAADRSAEKDFHLLGVETGAAGDYGHGDLAVGSALTQDLFEPVLEFLGSGDAATMDVDSGPASR